MEVKIMHSPRVEPSLNLSYINYPTRSWTFIISNTKGVDGCKHDANKGFIHSVNDGKAAAAVKVANDEGSSTGMDMAIDVVLEEEGAPSLEMVTEAVP